MSPEVPRINLDPASALYFRKLIVRKRSIENAIPLPGFSWEAERSRLGGMSDKELAKGFITSMAIAWKSIQTANDAAFAGLVKMSGTPERFEFWFHCPFAKVIAPVVNPKAREVIAADRSFDVGIRHRYALMDHLSPIVFVWQHRKQEMLVTNEFHMSNPAQFLTIDRVGTTSGLLNFIGAMNIMLLEDREAEVVSRLPALIKEAMDMRADEWLRWMHHVFDEQVIFEPKRLYVDENDGETYFYDYSGKPL